MNQNGTGSTGNAGGGSKIQNFLEALRNSQTNQSFSKTERSMENNPFAELKVKKELEQQRIDQFHSQRSQEWNELFSSEEKQRIRRIEYLQQELSGFAKRTKGLDSNLTKAISLPTTKPSIYQENFLEHIRTMIHQFTLKPNSANSWLEIYQSRSKKQGTYWGMANKKGSSFTQSNERSIATSVG